MSASSMVARGRTVAEELMVDTATITRLGAPSFNTSTGVLTDAAGTVIHEGPCRLRQPTPAETETLFGETQVALTRFIVCFPYDVDGVQVDDVITITETSDPDITGVEFRVAAIPLSTFTLYKGFPCEVVS